MKYMKIKMRVDKDFCDTADKPVIKAKKDEIVLVTEKTAETMIEANYAIKYKEPKPKKETKEEKS